MQAADAASYSVVVSNPVGAVPVNSISSNAATLTVDAAPSGTLTIDAFEVAGPPPRFEPPDTLTRQVTRVGYRSVNPNHPDPVVRTTDFRYECVSPSPGPLLRACTGATVNEAAKTFSFDTVLDLEYPGLFPVTPSDIRLTGTLTLPTCSP